MLFSETLKTFIKEGRKASRAEPERYVGFLNSRCSSRDKFMYK